jgi:hypothetical protein
MNSDRYGVIEYAGQHYVYDHVDNTAVGEGHDIELEAAAEAARRNREDSYFPLIVREVREERLRQDAEFGRHVRSSAEHLAIAVKKLGDVASTLLTRRPRERSLQHELTELTAVLVRWREDIERSV